MRLLRAMPALKLLHTYFGPSPHATDPVLVIGFEPTSEELSAAPEKTRLISAGCARWFKAPVMPAQPDALALGEFFAAWALAALNEMGGNIRVARAVREPDGVRLILGYHNQQLTLEGLALLREAFAKTASDPALDYVKLLKPFWRTCNRAHPDFQAVILMDYARKAGIPYFPVMPGSRAWQFGWGARSEAFFESSPKSDSNLGTTWGTHKQGTKYLFQKLGVPQAKAATVEKEADLPKAAKLIGFPCVTKPLKLGKSRGVTAGIRNEAELLEGFKAARKESQDPVIVEKYVTGENYRLLVVRGEFWKAIYRERPLVVGDGKSSVLQLAQSLQVSLTAELRPGSYNGPILLDDAFLLCLRNQDLRPGDIPAAGRRVFIREIPLAQTGARVMTDVTDRIHPDTREVCVMLAKYYGLNVCGIDFITEDISKSCFETGAFLEINSTPGIRTPITAGVDPDEVGRKVLGDIPGRIPFTLIVAPSAAQAGIPLPDGPGAGWARGGQVGIGKMRFGDTVANAHGAASRLLRNPTVTSATVVIDPAQLRELGLPVDRAHRTIVHPGTGLDDAWLETLRSHADEFTMTT